MNFFTSSAIAALMELLGAQLMYLEQQKGFEATSSLTELNELLLTNYRMYTGERNVTAWEQLLSFCMISLSNLLCFIYITGMKRMTVRSVDHGDDDDGNDDSKDAPSSVVFT